MRQPKWISELYSLDIFAKSQQVILRCLCLVKCLLIKDISDHWLQTKCDEHNQQWLWGLSR